MRPGLLGSRCVFANGLAMPSAHASRAFRDRARILRQCMSPAKNDPTVYLHQGWRTEISQLPCADPSAVLGTFQASRPTFRQQLKDLRRAIWRFQSAIPDEDTLLDQFLRPTSTSDALWLEQRKPLKHERT